MSQKNKEPRKGRSLPVRAEMMTVPKKDRRAPRAGGKEEAARADTGDPPVPPAPPATRPRSNPPTRRRGRSPRAVPRAVGAVATAATAYSVIPAHLWPWALGGAFLLALAWLAGAFVLALLRGGHLAVGPKVGPK